MKNDKRYTQVSLPLTYHPHEAKEYIKQHWNITFARQKKVSVYAKRIMANVMSMIKDDDDDLRPYYQIRALDIIQDSASDRASVYKGMKKAFEELVDLKWLFEDEKNDKFAFRHLLNTSDVNCRYENGTITVVLNPILKPMFIEIAHYTTYELKHYMTFSSWYSMRLFELLSAFKDTGKWVVSIDEYRHLMDCGDKYPKAIHLVDKTLAEPFEELSKTAMAFEYKVLYDEFSRNVGRKPISAIEFTLKKVELKKVPKEWLEYSDEHKKVIDLLLNTYQIEEQHVVKYAKAIGIEESKKLIRQWYNKKHETGDKKITDIKRYCNSIWCKVGKEALSVQTT
jgi:plasmid replication initiation protein